MKEKKPEEYIKDGELCSYPYHFELHKDGDLITGEETSYIYSGLKFNDEEKKEIEAQLKKIHTAEGAAFTLEGTDINYHIKMAGSPKESDMDNEVNIRRNFIENYLEAEAELDALVQKYHGSTKKTEFVQI
jgi:hypothetical protein